MSVARRVGCALLATLSCVAAVLLIAIGGLAVYILGARTIVGPFPELYGDWFFWRSCKGLVGLTVAEARREMESFVEPGRPGEPSVSAPPWLFGAKLLGPTETDAEVDNRLLFIPDPKGTSDWCTAYIEDGYVKRVRLSPD